MQLSNIYNLPQPLVSALSNNLYVKHGHISVTSLIQPPRIRQLMDRYSDMVAEDASDKIWMLLGSAVHDILQRADSAGIQEKRLSMEVVGWTVTGQADLMEGGVLSDYKVTSVWSGINGVKPEWEAQLNCYALLLYEHGIPVQDAQIVCIYRDWSKNRAKQGGGYPQCAAGVLPVNLWSYKDVVQYVRDRVQIHQQAAELDDHELPPCTPAERWERPTTYALMKEGRKSAVRVFDTEEAAHTALKATPGDKHYIETRTGQSVRCEDYCPVSEFCNQYKEG